MKPSEIEKIPLRVEGLFYDLQNRVMADVVRRIKKTGGLTSTADYQLNKVQIFGNSTEFIETEIKRIAKLTDPEIWKLYDDVVQKEYTRNKDLYEQINASFTPYDENEMMQSWVNAVVKQTQGGIENITNSLGFTVSMGGGKKVFTPLAEYYQKYLDRACMDIVTGSFDYNTVLRRVAGEMTASGLRTVTYANGRADRATVACRRAAMTGVRQLSNQINELNAEKFGTDTFEVEWHSGARDSHWWGGRVYPKRELISICGLGTGPGLGGWNCYHTYHAFIPGVSVRIYTDEQLEEMNAAEKVPREWRGEKYNAYEATQQQRKLEVLMQKQRADIKLLKDGKADKEVIMAAQSKYLSTYSQYHSFSDKMHLKPQMERVYVDRLGRMAGTGKLQKSKNSGIINTKQPKANKPQGKKPTSKNADAWDVNYKNNYKSKQEAIDSLKSRHGIGFVDSRKYPMDADLLQDCVSWLDSFSSTFKDFANKNDCKIPNIKCLAPSAMQAKNSVGYYSYYPNSKRVEELVLNGTYHSDIKGFTEYVKYCVDSKWYPENATVHKTFVHEYGHHVSNSLRNMKGEPGFEHGFISECIQEFKKTSGYKYDTHVGMGDFVSRYGATAEGELFAEAFAEYFGGASPREFAKIFGSKLEKILRSV